MLFVLLIVNVLQHPTTHLLVLGALLARGRLQCGLEGAPCRSRGQINSQRAPFCFANAV